MNLLPLNDLPRYLCWCPHPQSREQPSTPQPLQCKYDLCSSCCWWRWVEIKLPDFTVKCQEPVVSMLRLWSKWTASHCPLFCFSLGLDNMCLGLTALNSRKLILTKKAMAFCWVSRMHYLTMWTDENQGSGGEMGEKGGRGDFCFQLG